MEACLANGNKYAAWASKENVTKEVAEYSTKNKKDEPEDVIKRCDDYLAGLDPIEADKSLNLNIRQLKLLSLKAAPV